MIALEFMIGFQQCFNRFKNFLSTIDLRRLITIILLAGIIFFFLNSHQYQSQHFIPSICQNQNGTINITINSTLTRMIVISHFNEDLDWLDLFIGEQIPHIVYTRSNDQLARHNIRINKGREAVAYLRYIVENYSNLPSSIAFIHGHRTSWHQRDPSDIVVALRALRWHRYAYMPLTSTPTNAIFKLNTPDQQATVNFIVWRDVLQKELGSPPGNGVRTHCCASFVAKKEAILAHPKGFYSNILDYLVASSYSDQLTGRVLEYTWHIIFGQPTHISYRTCDLFVCDSNGMISVSLAEQNSTSTVNSSHIN